MPPHPLFSVTLVLWLPLSSFFSFPSIFRLLHSLILASCSVQYVVRKKSGCLHKLISVSLLEVFATSLLPTQTRIHTHNNKYPLLSEFCFSFLTLWNCLFCRLLHCFLSGSEVWKRQRLDMNWKDKLNFHFWNCISTTNQNSHSFFNTNGGHRGRQCLSLNHTHKIIIFFSSFTCSVLISIAQDVPLWEKFHTILKKLTQAKHL